MAETVVIHPNRHGAESRATRGAVVLLLLVSAGLILAVTAGGWARLQGAQLISFGCAAAYLVLAFYVARWNRGVLPVAAALGVLFGVVAAVAAPPWFDRDRAGFSDPALDPAVLGTLTLAIVPVQALLIAFAMRGFQQRWNVEVEVPREDADRYRHGGELPGGSPHAA